jgi:FAD/FMN-containing dehydrogenase
MEAPRENRSPLVPPGSIDHHIADLSATFAADVTLGAAQFKLREHGHWLPIDGNANETIGSLVERNSTGPLRLGFGGWRDLLLGAQFTNGSGELITAGGRTVKNVAGYDLTKFMVGQYGVFGTPLTLTTRVYKAPDQALLAAFGPDVKKLNALLVTACRPQWAVLTKDALLCGYFGDAAAAEFYEKSLPAFGTHEVIRHTLDDDIAVRAKLWRADSSAGFSFRASVPPSSLHDFTRAIDGSWCADAAFGIVIGSCASGARDALHKAASSAGGSAIVFDASGKPQNLTPDPNVKRLLERLK